MANITRMQDRADRLGVALRPHLKTMKAEKAAEALIAAGARGITVSTLKEAAYFLDHGFTDITYAVGLVPAKLPEVTELMTRGADLKVMTDSIDVATVIAEQADKTATAFRVLIEIDSGDHRGGLQAEDDGVVADCRNHQTFYSPSGRCINTRGSFLWC